MKPRLFASADEFLQKSDWRDLAGVKFCLFSMGLLAGLHITDRYKKGAGMAASVVFVLTYIPLMAKFLRIFAKSGQTC